MLRSLRGRSLLLKRGNPAFHRRLQPAEPQRIPHTVVSHNIDLTPHWWKETTAYHYETSCLATSHKDWKEVLLRPTLFSIAVGLGSFGLAGLPQPIERDSQQVNRDSNNKAGTTHQNSKDIPICSFPVIGPVTDHHKSTIIPLIGVNLLLYAIQRRILMRLIVLNKPKAVYVFLRTFYNHFKSGDALSVLLHGFTHADFGHLFQNMLLLWMFGPPCVELMGGRDQFYAAYVSSITVSCLADKIHYLMTRHFHQSCIV